MSNFRARYPAIQPPILAINKNASVYLAEDCSHMYQNHFRESFGISFSALSITTCRRAASFLKRVSLLFSIISF